MMDIGLLSDSDLELTSEDKDTVSEWLERAAALRVMISVVQ